MVANAAAQKWVEEMARMCQPDHIVWCDGSEEERRRLADEACGAGEIELLNQDKLPGGYLHRTAKNDVARTENLTFICTSRNEDAGPTNNWMAPKEAYEKLGEIFTGSMRGRTMYVVPFIMGIPGSPFNKLAIELTDSIYVVLNMRIMTRMGDVAMRELGDSPNFTRCLHSKADLDINRRFICHFPEDNTIWSVGSGYGGNVLLGKKCLALRVASHMGRSEGWMAEHMVILGLEDPQGRVSYVAAAFPSACGKTNLAMAIPPAQLKGYKVWTVGDDIAWMRIGPDGRLHAVNPEAGFFGVAPGTNAKTNPNAMATIARNSIFTNVVKTPDGGVWWEGMDGAPPAQGTDWEGQPWTPDCGRVGAHANARFTAPARQCPCISPRLEDPQGVPIDAILFGGRRAHLAPLVYEAFNWTHGVFMGATMASERTAAQFGKLGEVRRDPMAMLPFCGYHMGDYFAHWLGMGRRVPRPPRVFHVNWFRRGEDEKFLWPGFGYNVFVLKWIVDRCQGKAPARETPIGLMPTADYLASIGVDVPKDKLEKLMEIHKADWEQDIADQSKFFADFGDRLPQPIRDEQAALKKRLGL